MSDRNATTQTIPAVAEEAHTMNEQIQKACRTHAYLNQGNTWLPKDRPAIAITDMDESWRRNAANWLLRRAAVLADIYSFGEQANIYCATAREVVYVDKDGNDVLGPEVSLAPSDGSMAADSLERELHDAEEQRNADPDAWLKSTPLYRALLAGISAEVPA